MRQPSGPERWALGVFVLISTSTVAVVVLGPQYVEVYRDTTALRYGGLIGLGLAVGIATILLGSRLFRTGIAFAFWIIDAWLACLVVPVVFIGAVNAGFDRSAPVRKELTVVDKELRGRYGRVADALQARSFVLQTEGWDDEPRRRPVPVLRPTFDASQIGGPLVLCVYPGALGRQWLAKPSLREKAEC
jgi:hypothetical protein